jgi:LPXTG-motif cell wall-anchored protein
MCLGSALTRVRDVDNAVAVEVLTDTGATGPFMTGMYPRSGGARAAGAVPSVQCESHVKPLVTGMAILACAYAVALGCIAVFTREDPAWWAVLLGLALIATPLALMWWRRQRRHQ